MRISSYQRIYTSSSAMNCSIVIPIRRRGSKNSTSTRRKNASQAAFYGAHLWLNIDRVRSAASRRFSQRGLLPIVQGLRVEPWSFFRISLILTRMSCSSCTPWTRFSRALILARRASASPDPGLFLDFFKVRFAFSSRSWSRQLYRVHRLTPIRSATAAADPSREPSWMTACCFSVGENGTARPVVG